MHPPSVILICAGKNFSELFSIEPRYVPATSSPWSACSATCAPGAANATGTQIRAVSGCVVNPAQPLAAAPWQLKARCDALPVNLTAVGINDTCALTRRRAAESTGVWACGGCERWLQLRLL